MTITANRVGVWILDDTYKKVASGCWVYTTAAGDPGDLTLWVWGSNYGGSLGDNTTIPKSSPVQIPGTSWNSLSGRQRGMATKTDGTLWAWGLNTYGCLGDNTIIPKSSPVQIPGTSWCIVRAAAHILAVKTDGTLWAWGKNNHGQLGINSCGDPRSSPVQIPGTSWNDVRVGQNHSVARKTDDTL